MNRFDLNAGRPRPANQNHMIEEHPTPPPLDFAGDEDWLEEHDRALRIFLLLAVVALLIGICVGGAALAGMFMARLG